MGRSKPKNSLTGVGLRSGGRGKPHKPQAPHSSLEAESSIVWRARPQLLAIELSRIFEHRISSSSSPYRLLTENTFTAPPHVWKHTFRAILLRHQAFSEHLGAFLAGSY